MAAAPLGSRYYVGRIRRLGEAALPVTPVKKEKAPVSVYRGKGKPQAGIVPRPGEMKRTKILNLIFFVR